MLRPSYHDLSLIDPRNDSQTLFYDQIVPSSTLLGYLNADHWAVAMPLARDAVLMNLLVDHNAFPREIVLEAILKQIEEDLIAVDGPEGHTAARPVTDAGVNARERTDSGSVTRQPW